MKPDQHVTISVGSGVILGLLARSWVAGVSCCAVGILVDLDHFLDFWLNRGFRLSIKEFLEFIYHGTSRKFFDVLHGYEYVPLLCWVALQPGFQNLGLGMTVGYVLHLLGDQFFNNHLSRWTYFLTFRMIHRFESSCVVLPPPLPEPHPHN